MAQFVTVTGARNDAVAELKRLEQNAPQIVYAVCGERPRTRSLGHLSEPTASPDAGIAAGLYSSH